MTAIQPHRIEEWELANWKLVAERDASVGGPGSAARVLLGHIAAIDERVAELETLHDAAAKANAALESIGEQARRRIVDLTRGLREALNAGFERVLDVRMYERLYRLVERAEAETPADPAVSTARETLAREARRLRSGAGGYGGRSPEALELADAIERVLGGECGAPR